MPLSSLKPMTPYGHAEMQLRQPLQTSFWMYTVSNSVRMSAFVGQTSRQLAFLQCLQTSSQALHPMQIDVSVKKPSGFSCQAISLKPHQVPHDLGVAALGGGQIERDRGELVDDGHGARLAMLIDRDEIAAADLAGVHAQVWKALRVREDRK